MPQPLVLFPVTHLGNRLLFTGVFLCLARFEGQVKPDRGTASYIVFCAVIGLLAAGLVISIAVPAVGASDFFCVSSLFPLLPFDSPVFTPVPVPTRPGVAASQDGGSR